MPNVVEEAENYLLQFQEDVLKDGQKLLEERNLPYDESDPQTMM